MRLGGAADKGQDVTYIFGLLSLLYHSLIKGSSLLLTSKTYFVHQLKGTSSYKLVSIKAVNWDFDKAPTLVASTLPSLNSMRVGMPRMP